MAADLRWRCAINKLLRLQILSALIRKNTGAWCHLGPQKGNSTIPSFMFVMICIDKIATLEYKPPLNKLILPFGWTGPEMASSHCRCHPWSLSSLWQSFTKSKAKHTACSQSLARSLPISTRQICLTRHTWGSEVLSFNNAWWWLQIPNHWPPRLAGLTNSMGSLSEFHCTLTLSHGMPASFREKGHKGEGGIARRLLLKAAGGWKNGPFHS